MDVIHLLLEKYDRQVIHYGVSDMHVLFVCYKRDFIETFISLRGE